MADAFAMDRALGALAGVAIGDAMGMPSQTMTADEITRHYGRITDFVAPCEAQVISAGLKAGTITDDMEQTLLLAQHLIDHAGAMQQQRWAETLLNWERDTRARGVNDLLGPSTKRAVDALQRGCPLEDAGREGTTNGAAMRIAPVGIANPAEPLQAFLDAVEDSCRLTHNTGLAIAAASAVAAVISRGISGATFRDAVPFALECARAGERRGAVPMEGSFVPKLSAALELADRANSDGLEVIAHKIGVSVAAFESVPMAFAIALRAEGSVWDAAVASANIGDDTDTIGAIACGMLGAGCGLQALPQDKWAIVRDVNRLALTDTAAGLLRLRTRLAHGRSARSAP